MSIKKVVELLLNNGFKLNDSEVIPYELDPSDESFDLHIDSYIKDDKFVILKYDELEILSVIVEGKDCINNENELLLL